MTFHPDDLNTWPVFTPLIIAHDVGRTRDRSTAVVGGNSPCGRRLVGLRQATELPQGLYGSPRASALATVDRQHGRNALIVADLSYDPSYVEDLMATFGRRVIGLQISRHGNGMDVERRPVAHSCLPVYTIGRSYLIDLFHSQLQSDAIRFSDCPGLHQAYEQLASLETEHRESGVIYSCPPGKHDDLGISCAMLVWAAQHVHLASWVRAYEMDRRPRKQREKVNWAAWT